MDYLKIQKVFNRIKHIRNTMDILEYENGILSLKGWVYSADSKIKDFRVVIKSAGKNYPVEIGYGIERADVYQTYQHEHAKNCGFYGRIVVENLRDFTVYLVFRCGGRNQKMFMGKYSGTVNAGEKPIVKLWKDKENGIDLLGRRAKNQDWEFVFPEQYRKEQVDILVPVYNGYEFLETLLKTIPNTEVPYRLYLIDDCSPDERVYPYLEEYAKKHDHVFLYRNEENLGFVRTVNKGFELTKNHVAIVNTDVEVPDQWLERLMYPILSDPKVATATPYTNCGTNCSFPRFYKDNELFLNLDLKSIDEAFQNMQPSYEKMPTGVGFCMGMNRKVLDEIGLFDAESFGKGYGEENDWCQRAAKKGYKNVQVENLFVYHKHGGSFLSEDKKRFIKEHEKVLLKKHPLYNKEVSRFYTIDPNREVRECVKLDLIFKYERFHHILAFDHDLGGGATSYLEGKRQEELKAGKGFTVVRYGNDGGNDLYKVRFYYRDQEVRFCVRNRKDLFDVLKQLRVNEIWINELVTYPNLYELMDEIAVFKDSCGARMRMLLHDFYPVCPTINLLDCNEKYCRIQQGSVCDNCLKRVKSLQYLYYGSMKEWRRSWKKFFGNCEEIVVFSPNSKEILENAFGKLAQVKVIPHLISYIPKLEKTYKTTKTLNIGLLGVLAKHKGRDIVAELAEIIEKKKLNIRIILIGSTIQKISSGVFKETGAYTRDMIPRLTLENDIDVFLIPSIWPETFSYTTEEIMHMGMPVMSFDIGAPAERIRKYEKGLIIPAISAEKILETIKGSRLIKDCMKLPRRDRKVLFVVEEVTFSSRYRVDHLREQLLYQGIDSDCLLVDQCQKKNLKEYNSVVVYRSSQVKTIKGLVQKAHEAGIKVYYDIDDYIFDYPAIRNLDFLKGKDYEEFEQYSGAIRATMECCDGFIVSTNNLKNVIEEKIPGKSVYINRNAASMEMVTVSMGIQKEPEPKKVVLGYFSGTKTHDKDFERIKEDVLFIMDQNPQVSLLVGGQIDLPKEFHSMRDRIETFKFVPWKKLPKLIARADINLMPLEDTVFHACKSENKWMEAALVDVPTVASFNNELEQAITTGDNGYLCRTGEDWRRALQTLIDEENLRNQIAASAKKKVLEMYTTLSVEPEIIKILSN